MLTPSRTRSVASAALMVAVFLAWAPAAAAVTWTTSDADVPRFDAAVASNTGLSTFNVIGGLGFPPPSGTRVGPLAYNAEYIDLLDGWTEDRPLPSARTGLAAVTTSPDFTYALGGMNAKGAILAANDVFDRSTVPFHWVAKAPMPSGRVNLSAAALNNHIYAIGGDVLKNGVLTPTRTVQIYDTTTDTWTAGPRLPVPLDDTGAAAPGTDANIYVFGGWDNGAQAHAYSLDTSNLGAGWVALPDYANGRGSAGSHVRP